MLNSHDYLLLSGLKSELKLMGILENDFVSRPFRNITEQEKLGLPDILKELGLDSKH